VQPERGFGRLRGRRRGGGGAAAGRAALRASCGGRLQPADRRAADVQQLQPSQWRPPKVCNGLYGSVSRLACGCCRLCGGHPNSTPDGWRPFVELKTGNARGKCRPGPAHNIAGSEVAYESHSAPPSTAGSVAPRSGFEGLVVFVCKYHSQARAAIQRSVRDQVRVATLQRPDHPTEYGPDLSFAALNGKQCDTLYRTQCLPQAQPMCQSPRLQVLAEFRPYQSPYNIEVTEKPDAENQQF